MDAEIKMLENEITQACLVDKPRMTKKDTDDHTTTLEYCHKEFMTLLPWLQCTSPNAVTREAHCTQ